MTLRARAIWAALGVLALTTKALACPQCAGRDTYGMGFVFLLLSMIVLPFSIVALVVRAVRAIRSPWEPEEIVK